jgi:tRNA A-37 threonylcarbamoyl transferase component Bud32
VDIKLDQEIQAKYEVLAIMGEGGMGAVYKVRHRYLDEIQVIKLVRDRFQADEELRARFLREAKTAKKLRHPNIAEVIDYSVTSSGTAFIVMEFIEGVNLREVMTDAGGVLDSRFVAEIGRQTLSALGYLHRRGFVHRDISPENLMLSSIEGMSVIKLIDLGIAKSLAGTSNLTLDGRFVGKVQYASPEQFGASEIDQRSDLYSLGVVLYELLTGIAPIGGSDFRAIIAGHLTRPPRAFGETDPKGRVPAALREVILTALQKEPADRYATADAFATALQPITADALPARVDRFRASEAEGHDRPVAETILATVTELETRDEVRVTVPPVALPAAVTTTSDNTALAAGTAIEHTGNRGLPRRSMLIGIALSVLLVIAAAVIMLRQQQRKGYVPPAVAQVGHVAGTTMTVSPHEPRAVLDEKAQTPEPVVRAEPTDRGRTAASQGNPDEGEMSPSEMQKHFPQWYRMRVVLHVRVGDATELAELAERKLRAAGYAVPVIRRVSRDNAPSSATQVRYFHKSDRAGADRLVMLLNEWGIHGAKKQYLDDFKNTVPSSQYEIWFVPR